MFRYTFDLMDLGYEEDEYDAVATRALKLARGASAIDTGRFRTSWAVSVTGSILTVSNGL